jgi:lipopolysaccharide transport system permease protein
VIAMPLALAPYLVMLYGLTLIFAALGVYIRDLGQVVMLLVMVVLFTGNVFFPLDMVPAPLQGIIRFNPISWPIETMRNCILHGRWPDSSGMVQYGLAAILVYALGWRTFAVLRRGFADLL